MVALTAAVIAVGLLCLVDLLLTFGVIRRLRQHTELLSNRGADVEVLSLPPGRSRHVQRADDGRPRARRAAGIRLAAFFCPPARSARSGCPVRRLCAANHVARADVLAVVLGPKRFGALPGPAGEVAASACSRPTASWRRPSGARVPSVLRLDADGTVGLVSYDPAACRHWSAAVRSGPRSGPELPYRPAEIARRALAMLAASLERRRPGVAADGRPGADRGGLAAAGDPR